MPWPQKDLTTRVLAGIVGALLGAMLGFLIGAGPSRSLNDGHPPLLAFTLVSAGIAAGLSFWLGDPAVRYLMEMLGGGARKRF